MLCGADCEGSALHRVTQIRRIVSQNLPVNPPRIVDARPLLGAAPLHENGIRALAKLLFAYRGGTECPAWGGGIDTVREVTNRSAPGVENDTESYITAVAAGVGALPNQPINLRSLQTLTAITLGMIKHENGGVPYSASVIAGGVHRALS